MRAVLGTAITVTCADNPPLLTGVDDVGKQLIEELQQDGRRSYAALAKTVGLSEAAVRQRVQRLVDSGLMQVVAVTDPLQVGFHRQAMIGVRVEGDLVEVADELGQDRRGRLRRDHRRLVRHPAASWSARTTTTCCGCCPSGSGSLPGVRDTETFVYLKLAKQTYAWGTR